MSEVRVAWDTLTTFLSKQEGGDITTSSSQFQNNFTILKHAKLDALFISWYLDHLRQSFAKLAPAFWGHFPSNCYSTTQTQVFQAVALAHSTYLNTKIGSDMLVHTLTTTVSNANENSFISPRAFLDRFHALATSAVFNAAPSDFQKYMFVYFKKTFLDFQKQKKITLRKNKMEQDEEEEEEEEEEDLDIIEGRIEAFRMCVARLRELGWLGRFEEAFTEMLYVELDNYIIKLCKDEFEENILETLVNWADDNICSWLQVLFENTSGGGDAILSPGEPNVQAWKSRLKFHLYERFCELRTSELFDIIKLFPDSQPSLLDFRSALERTHQQKKIIRSLQNVLQRRLLHPGANTSQIIDIYVATIKTLRILDPTGILLESISEPIKDYLRGRHDTVRCIVGSLTDDTSSDLFEELGRGEAKPIEHDDSDDDDAFEGGGDENSNVHNNNNNNNNKKGNNPKEWMPDPIDADPTKTSKSRRSNDILSMLVQIYGSKELFVTEYRFILADKLLKRDDFDTDKEVRTLELLKLRFGESSMHACEVMVKDIADSKRVNTTIRDKKQREDGISVDESSLLGATVVSRHYWPPFKGEEVELHGRLKEYYDDFSNEYRALKAPRSVEWKPQLGFVEIEIEIGGNTRSYNVSPALASVVMNFEDNEQWSLKNIAESLKLSEALAGKYLNFWVNNGILKVVDNQSSGRSSSSDTLYTRMTEMGSEDAVSSSNAGQDDDGGAEAALAAKRAELEREMNVYESYIVGMLRNFNSLPLDRIHNMLKMFVAAGEHKYDKEITSLEQFLDHLCNEEKLESDGMMYSLPK